MHWSGNQVTRKYCLEHSTGHGTTRGSREEVFNISRVNSGRVFEISLIYSVGSGGLQISRAGSGHHPYPTRSVISGLTWGSPSGINRIISCVVTRIRKRLVKPNFEQPSLWVRRTGDRFCKLFVCSFLFHFSFVVCYELRMAQGTRF